MSFLPDVAICCEARRGDRSDHETLAVRMHDQSIADVLALNAAVAAKVFDAHPRIAPTLDLLVEVGLGYLKLGQPIPPLSGARRSASSCSPSWPSAGGSNGGAEGGGTLYVVDEPTIGLHMATSTG